MRTILRLLSCLPERFGHRLIRSQMRVEDAELEGVEVGIAVTYAERLQAARLLHDTYVLRGILTPDPSGMRLTEHLAATGTAVFIARKNEKVIGTLALIPDSSLGLPMESIYGEEIAKLRRSGRRIAEVGALCIAPGHRRIGLGFLLNKLMWRYAREILKVDDLVIAVHPEAAPLYKAALLFESFGSERTYPGLNRSARAAAMRLDLRLAAWNYKREFEALPSDYRNPYYMYMRRKDAQIRMPDALDRLRAVEVQRQLDRSMPAIKMAVAA